MIYDSLRYMEDLKEICSEPLPYEKLEGSRVMVTGANGLIASGVVDALMMLNKLHNYQIQIYALCRNERKAKKRFCIYENHPLFKIWIQDMNEELTLPDKCDYIIHAAGNAHPYAYATEPVETMKSNLLGTINLLEYAKKYEIKRFLFISSSEIYGNSDNTIIYKEDDMGYIDSMQVRSCYPEGKRAAETLCVSYAKEYGLDTVIVRPGYIYGAAMNADNTRADTQFIQKAIKNENIVMKSDGMQYRSYCYITDAVVGIFCTLLLGESANAYNIANENSSASIREFAEILAELSKVELQFENPDDKEKKGYSKIKRAVLDSEKLQNLGWKPKVTLKEGLERIVEILQMERE